MSALILGTLLNYLVTKDPVAEAYKAKMENLGSYMEAKALPTDLAQRVFSHFQFQHSKNVQNKATASVRLPKSLEMKVAYANYNSTVEKCLGNGKPFSKCSPQFITTLMTKLTVIHVNVGEEVVKKGEIARELLFVQDGFLQVVDEENRVKKVIRNDVPGM